MGEDVTIDAGTSTISIGTVGNVSAPAEIGDINYTAATVTLTGNQIASADQDTANSDTGTFEITGATVIDGAVTISSDVSTGTSGTNEDGTITFNGTGTIVGTTGSGDNLTINSGSGAISFGSTIGVAQALNDLSINASGGAASLTIPQIGNGTTAAGTDGTTSIGNSATTAVSLSAATYMFGGGATTITSGGHITTRDNTGGVTFKSNGNITIDPANGSAFKTTGALSIQTTADNNIVDIKGDMTGVDDSAGTAASSVETISITDSAAGGTIKIAGDVDTQYKSVTLTAGDEIQLGGTITTINTADNDVDINGPVTLTAATTINTGANDGTIDFSSTIDGTFNLTLDSNSGAIGVGGAIGGSTKIAVLDINHSDGAGIITLSGGIGNQASGAAGTTSGSAVDIGNLSLIHI